MLNDGVGRLIGQISDPSGSNNTRDTSGKEDDTVASPFEFGGIGLEGKDDAGLESAVGVDNDLEWRKWANLEGSDEADSTCADDSVGVNDHLEWLKRANLEDSDEADSICADDSSRPEEPSSLRMPLPPDLDSDWDLLNPRAHKAKIDRVQASAVANSAFYVLAQEKEDDNRALPSLNQRMPRILFPERGFNNYESLDTKMWTPLEPVQIWYVNFAYMATLWRVYTGSNRATVEPREFPRVAIELLNAGTLLRLHRDLLESRNLLVRVCFNVRELCQSRISQGSISILVVSDSRPGVASLQSVSVNQVYKFTQLVDSLLNALYWSLSRKTTFPIVEQGTRGDVGGYMSNLGKIGDAFEAEVLAQDSRFGLQAVVDICRVMGHVLDVGLLTYCDTHLQALDETFLGRRTERFEIHYPVLSTKTQAQSPAVVMRPRSVSCLHKFLHERKVWVFHYGLLGKNPGVSSDAKLYLSTSIEAFADIWGPIWKVSPKGSTDNVVLRYNVGLGAIVPWTRSLDSEPEKLPEEAFCHWIQPAEIASHEETTLTINGQENPLLLIGGAPKVTISPSMECCADPVSLLHTMQCQGSLQRFGTANPHRYRDSETIQLQAGYGPVHGAYQAQFKHRPGVTWKEYFVERWKMEPDRRNPRLLEYWLGVEVSLCTFNSRRQRLLRILESKPMRNHLLTAFFTWTDPKCEPAYYSALNSEDSYAFYNLYVSRPDWRLELGTAVSLCFEVLLQTGLDHNQDLKAFYAPTSTGQEWLAMIRHKDHSWAGLLKDSEHCATMAVATETCLEVSKPGWPKFPGQQCRQGPNQGDTFTVLETKLVCYRSSKEPKSRDRHLPDSRLSIGSSGFLKVLIGLKRDGLLVRWNPRTPFLGKAQEYFSACGQHSEHMGDGFLKVNPSEIYVVSRNASKLLPVARATLRSKEAFGQDQGAPQAHATNSNLDYLLQDPCAPSAPSHSATSSKEGRDVDSEQKNPGYVLPLYDVSRCTYSSELEAKTTTFIKILTHLSTNAKAAKAFSRRPLLMISLLQMSKIPVHPNKRPLSNRAVKKAELKILRTISNIHALRSTRLR